MRMATIPRNVEYRLTIETARRGHLQVLESTLAWAGSRYCSQHAQQRPDMTSANRSFGCCSKAWACSATIRRASGTVGRPREVQVIIIWHNDPSMPHPARIEGCLCWQRLCDRLRRIRCRLLSPKTLQLSCYRGVLSLQVFMVILKPGQ